MELKTFTEFRKLLDQVRARKEFLCSEIAELNRVLDGKMAAFDEAILEGADPEELQDEIDALQRKVYMKKRELGALDAALSGKTRQGKIHNAARAVWNEGVEIITKDLRGEWDSNISKLEEAKAMFLAVVSALGAIKRRADNVTSKLSFGLEQFLPPAGVPSLSTNIYPERHVGVIFPDHHKIERAFLKGE
jgi:GH15 family glucan-1,4-alpha-glucosidase